MRLKIDENLPLSLVDLLAPLGHDGEHVVEEGLEGHDDLEVWQAAQREGRALITQDIRFADARMFSTGSHYGLILVRVKKPSKDSLKERIVAAFAAHAADDWSRCFVVIGRDRVRVRRPIS